MNTDERAAPAEIPAGGADFGNIEGDGSDFGAIDAEGSDFGSDFNPEADDDTADPDRDISL
ncbi:hypothetical protein [Dactylosporangium sp. NPDC049140]|jgi:hypothetical protein|uniref:hypothetical protein n=1 Tax=Dactylosporangium sp. NPDC049140 TaxID=3155647 RepID=UPI0033EB7209